jgi:DNA-binding transcriptional LysR family regulator
MLGIDDLPSLALFARVVHLRSFSAAAREAGIAKSAVSRRVARLEDALGVRLLRRSTRSLSVTEEGLRVFEQCAKIVAAAGAAEEAAGLEGGIARGVLRVGAPVTFAEMHLGRAIGQFLREHPEVDVQLSTDNRLADVVEDAFDVVVRVGRLADSSYYAKKLATDRLVVCGSPEYLERCGTPERPEDLSEHNCLRYALVPAAGEWRFRGRDGRPATLTTRGNFTVDDGGVLRSAALAGLGLAVLPSFMVKREVTEGRLRLVLEGARRAEIGIYAVTAHRTHGPLRVRVFVDFIARHFARFESASLPRRN